MSADNWTVCPRCLDQAEADRAAKVQAAADAYGNAPADEYERLRAESQEPIDRDALTTFREDYEFHGAEGGAITAVYKGGCQACDLGVQFKHVVPFYERAPAAPASLVVPADVPEPGRGDPS